MGSRTGLRVWDRNNIWRPPTRGAVLSAAAGRMQTCPVSQKRRLVAFSGCRLRMVRDAGYWDGDVIPRTPGRSSSTRRSCPCAADGRSRHEHRSGAS